MFVDAQRVVRFVVVGNLEDDVRVRKTPLLSYGSASEMGAKGGGRRGCTQVENDDDVAVQSLVYKYAGSEVGVREKQVHVLYHTCRQMKACTVHRMKESSHLEFDDSYPVGDMAKNVRQELRTKGVCEWAWGEVEEVRICEEVPTE